jgi:hypothetical protein
MDATPRYLRFARSLALVSVLGATAPACCPVIPDSVVCAHCTCWSTPRSVSQPLMCETLHRATQCCVSYRSLPVVGPLSPPDLAA